MKREKYKWHFLRFLFEAKAYKAFIDNVEVNDNPFRGKYGVESLKCLFDSFSLEDWIWISMAENKRRRFFLA